MKKILVIFLLINSFVFSQDYFHFEELRGLEDSLGNTHLFYREVYPTTSCWDQSIYHFNVSLMNDTFFIYDFGFNPEGWGCVGDAVFDYEFFNDDPSKYIYGGYNLNIDPASILIRYDGEINLPSFEVRNIEISRQNDSIVYVDVLQGIYKSTDGGYNFVLLDNIQTVDVSLVSLSKNDDSQIYGIDDHKLVRSENDGNSYIIVDSSDWSEDAKLYYDSDQDHIYGVTHSYNYQKQSFTPAIFISDDNGNPFTWEKRIEYPGKLYFTLDEKQPGEIYYSAGKRIFRSTDYGTTFTLYKELERNITGLYKKSKSNILYVSTPLIIYEITPDTFNVIKEMQIPKEVFSWFPLGIGNKWIYNHYGNLERSEFRWKTSWEVIENKTIGNRVYKGILVSEYHNNSPVPEKAEHQYFRTDSISGIIYKAFMESDTVTYKEVYMDLLAEVGDTIPVENGLILTYESPSELFSFNSTKREFRGVITPYRILEFVKGLGFSFGLTEDLLSFSTDSLKGCFIDGVVYGDTSLITGVNDKPYSVFNYKLEQNYPNPFNPTTNIRFQIPESGMVTLKVYNILGKEVATLVKEERSAGSYEVEFDASSLPSGVYFYQLKAGSFIKTNKMILLK
ncbi:T9SS type A sorting domain-containing protein [bacterium BMS3Abin03]|nr:T9SS type A sorting domain-containing protein [bacterium BMS3Abin03]